MWAVSQKRTNIRESKKQAYVDRNSVYDLHNDFLGHTKAKSNNIQSILTCTSINVPVSWQIQDIKGYFVQLRERNLVPRASGCCPLFGDVYSVLSMPSKFC